MLLSRRHKSCHSEDCSLGSAASEDSCQGRAPSDVCGAGLPSSDDSSPPPTMLSDSCVVVEDVQEEQASDADACPTEEELLAGPSLVIGQNEMLLLEMCVSRVVQEMETRCVSRMLEMDRKVDTLTQLCSGLSDKLDAVLGPATDGSHRSSLPDIQTKLDSLVRVCSDLSDKMDSVFLSSAARRSGAADRRSRSPADGSRSPDQPVPMVYDTAAATTPVIPLNRESEYPDGSWLGDPHNPRMRVRCKIHPLEMTRLSRHCVSAEKLAVTLLDHLFHREVLAESNISGRGRHCKKQLDPLMIYGIYCHLVTHHNVTEKEWLRIKQNMDAKCRSMWKRKQRGKPLGIGKYINKQQKRWAGDQPASVKSESPGLVFSDDPGLVVMETMPVADVVEVKHTDYLSSIELADFSNVKVIQTSMVSEVRLLGSDSSDLLPSNNVSLHEASARGDTDRLQASSRQFRAVIREQPMDEKQQRLMLGSVND